MTALIRRLALIASISFVFLFLLGSPASAQTSAIEGEVLDDTGQPMKGAMILIERTDITGNYKVKTNKKGRYFHAGLPLGVYTVKLEVDGSIKDQVAGVRTSLGENTEVNFDLLAIKRKQEALQKAAAAGQLTAEQTQGLTDEQKAAIEKQMEERSKAMKKNKELNDAFNAAMVAKESRQWEVAVENFEKAVEIDPEQHVVWAHMADSYMNLADAKTGAERDEALARGIEAYGKVLEMKPEDASYHNNYGLALARAGRMEEATAELEKAAELNPANGGQYFYNLGAVLINTGQQEAAGMAFKRAIETQPDYANAHFQYGMYLLSKAQVGADGSIQPPEGTAAALEKYLELDPNGQFAPSAQGALQSLQGTVETEYSNPDSQKTRKD